MHPQCNMWYHASCISMPSSEYYNLDSDTSWYCFQCNSFNVDSFSYHAYNIPVRNSFSPLLNISSGTFERTMSLSSPGMPQHFSSPVSTNHILDPCCQKINFSNFSSAASEGTPQAISAGTPSGLFPMDMSRHLGTSNLLPVIDVIPPHLG